MQKMKIKDLFNELGYNYLEMEKNEPINVLKHNVKVMSYDAGIVFKRIKNIVRKSSTKKYVVKNEEFELLCSGEHKVAMVNGEEIIYVEINQINDTFFGLNNRGEITMFSVEQSDEEIEILDIEVEDTHCYFANGILSHNTLYGSPETVQGGRGLKFAASTRIDVRRDSDITVDGNNIGHVVKFKTIKNKTARPQQTTFARLDWGKGFNRLTGLIALAISEGVIHKAGAGWLTLPNGKKIQGDVALVTELESNKELYDQILELLGMN